MHGTTKPASEISEVIVCLVSFQYFYVSNKNMCDNPASETMMHF